MGRPRALTSQEEEAVVTGILYLADWGFPVDQRDLNRIIIQHVNKIKFGVKYFKNGVPGTDFITRFIRRHREVLQLRFLTNYSRKRPSLTAAVLMEYFDHLEKSLEGVPFSNTYNYDKTYLTDDLEKKKSIIQRRMKYPYRITDSSKGAISIMFCASAAGYLMSLMSATNQKDFLSTGL